MAYWIISNTKISNLRQFQCDFLSDIGKLPTVKKIGAKQKGDTVSDNPCIPGSECFCYEDGSIWLLGMENDKWVKVGYKYGNSSGNTSSGNPTITSYNQLTDVPLKNATGNTSTPLVLENLQPGIYKITGNYSLTSNSKILSANDSGDIFIVSGQEKKITEVGSNGITLFKKNDDGHYATDTYPTTEKVSAEIQKQINSDDFSTKIEDKINETLNMSYITDSDIDDLF